MSRSYTYKIDNPGMGCTIPFILLFLSAIPAWLTHIFFCLSHSAWGFLIAGALCFPIGIIHGWGLWMGFFH